MKAVLCKQFGPPDSLVVEDVPSPKTGPGEVVVSVKAASVNFPDVLIIQNKYQFKPPLPFSPGSELAGVVKEVGAGVSRWKPGDKVMAFTTYGAFAEEVKTEANRLLPIPQGMPFPEAAAFVLTYGTTDHALSDRGALAEGETLLVLGAAGGVGLAAVDIGSALGAQVIAAASTQEKLDAACAAGARERINYSTADLKDEIKRLTGGKGADVVYDPVGGALSEPALRGTGWNGRFLVVGFASGEIPHIPLNLPLLKNNAIKGVFLGGFMRRDPVAYFQNVQELIALYESGRIDPLVSQVLPFERYEEAFGLLTGRQAIGKIVLDLKAS